MATSRKADERARRASAASRQLQQAEDLIQQGDMRQAEALARGLLADAAGAAGAWNLLGFAAFQRGELLTAGDYFRQALLASPENADARANLQDVRDLLRQQGLRPRCAAAYCVWGEERWLRVSVEGVYDACDTILFLLNSHAWTGFAQDQDAAATCISAIPDPEGKFTLVRGEWVSEAAERNAALDMLLASDTDWCLVVDADEVYHPAALSRLLRLAAANPEVDRWHVPLFTYWKSEHFRIDPPEPLKPPVLVRPGRCRFTLNRTAEGGLARVVSPETVVCHHFSYARTDEEVQRKISTFSHAAEVRPGWFQNIWKGWDADHSLTGLHPTHPQAYARAIEVSAATLPPQLRPDAVAAESGTPEASIIVLAHNQLEFTRRCVDSVLRNTEVPFELIVLDNASTDDTPRYLRDLARQDSRVRPITSDVNAGFAAGNNMALREARGQWLVLLNNDTVVTDGWLSRMIRVARQDVRTGVVGPLSNSVSGVQHLAETPYDENTLDGLDKFACQWAEAHDGEQEPFWRAVGFCMLIRRDVLETVGGLDERFGPGNFEDDDFCLRAALAGFRTVIARDSFVHHYGGRTFLAGGGRQQALLRNWELFKSKWDLPADLAYGQGFDVTHLLSRPFDSTRHFFPLNSGDVTAGASFETVRADGLEALARQDWAAAAEALRRALEACPDDSATANALAVALLGQGSLRECRRLLQGILGKHPDDALAHRSLGVVFARSGKLAEALSHACSAVEAQAGDGVSAGALRDMLAQVPAKGSRGGASVPSRLVRRAQAALQAADSAAAGADVSISLCLIARNEERLLADCLESVKGVCSQIVVVDTGSTDRTVEIARAHGADVHTFPWNGSFADARNESLRHARGKWVLVLDADERLEATSRDALLAAAGDSRADGWSLALHSVMPGNGTSAGQEFIHRVCRLFRNRPEYRFQGRVHEVVEPAILDSGGFVAALGVRVTHLGYSAELCAGRDKVRRNLELLEEEVSKSPDSPRLLFELGLMLVETDSPRAESLLRRAFDELDSRNPFIGPMCCVGLVRALGAQKRWADAVSVLDEAAARGMTHPSLPFWRGVALQNLGRPAAAGESFAEALRLGAQRQEWCGDPATWGLQASKGAARAFLQAGEFRQAGVYARRALQDEPDCLESLEIAAASAEVCGDLEEALSLRQRICSLRPDDAAAAIWRLAAELAVDTGCSSAQACLAVAKDLQAAGRWQDAAEACQRSLSLRPGLPEAYLVLGDCCERLGAFDSAAAAYAEAVRLRELSGTAAGEPEDHKRAA